jgi:hypothetical protein
MSVSFLAAGVAAAAAAVITAVLVVRFARLPRLDQAAWACAAAGLTIALAAQALGYHRGFNAAAFRRSRSGPAGRADGPGLGAGRTDREELRGAVRVQAGAGRADRHRRGWSWRPIPSAV